MVFLYAAVRFFDLYRTNRSKEFVLAAARGTGAYLWGLGLGAAVLLPSIMVFMNGTRSGVHNYDAEPWVYSYVRLLRLIIPPGNWVDMAFAAIVVFALILLLSGQRRRRTLQILVVTAFAVYVSKYGTLIMNGMQYPSQRWTFGLTLAASYAVAEMLPELLNPSRGQRLICLAVLLNCGKYSLKRRKLQLF